MILLKNQIKKKVSKVFFTPVLMLISNSAMADQLTPLTGATNWVTKTIVTCCVTILGLQIIFRLWQYNQGQKELTEIAKPILVTAAIVAVPTVVSALISAMNVSY